MSSDAGLHDADGRRVAEYRITVKPSAAKEFDELAPTIASRIEAKIAALSSNPRPPGVKKLKGALDLWRIRAGDWRVIYAIDDRKRAVDIVRIRHRSKAYE
ncbi:MAG: type II toxin-antitoxin system RelE/ParE family toxin [Thermoanaerobaculia bacterium]